MEFHEDIQVPNQKADLQDITEQRDNLEREDQQKKESKFHKANWKTWISQQDQRQNQNYFLNALKT